MCLDYCPAPCHSILRLAQWGRPGGATSPDVSIGSGPPLIFGRVICAAPARNRIAARMARLIMGTIDLRGAGGAWPAAPAGATAAGRALEQGPRRNHLSGGVTEYLHKRETRPFGD